MNENTEDHDQRRILKRSNRRNNQVFNGYDRGGAVYRDYIYYSYYNPYEEIQRKEMEMQKQRWIEEKRRRTTTTTVAPTTELTQQHTTSRNMTHDWFTIHLHTERTTWPPRTLVDRAALQPPTTPSSSSNSPSASFLNAMLIPVLIAVPVLLIALCFMAIMLFRAKRLRQQSNARCGLQRCNAWRERREPDEWSNMIATRLPLQRQDFDTVILDNLEAILNPAQLRSAQHRHNDKPPPYTECTRTSDATSKIHVREEPPPPYSACYVANTDAEPKVHKRRENVLEERVHSSTEIVNAQNEFIENGPRRDVDNMTTSYIDTAQEMRTELIFANGRIIETASLVLNSTNNEAVEASNDNIEEQSTRQAHFNDKVVYIDETTSENNTPDK